jgi:hypothetical protein
MWGGRGFMTDAEGIVKYSQKSRPCENFSVTVQEVRRGKRAKTRENERLSLTKLKKSKFFSKST